MPRDFYSTVAQVLPVLLLALVWESRYLERVRGERRQSRRDDPVDGVRFWTKPRIRAYALFVASVVLGDVGLCVLTLAGTIPDSLVLRGIVTTGVLLAVASLLFRISVEILDATQVPDTDTTSGLAEPAGQPTVSAETMSRAASPAGPSTARNAGEPNAGQPTHT